MALDARHDAVAVERLADVRRGHVEVALALAADLGDHEAVAGGAAGEAAHDEVHAVRQADARAADLHEVAVVDQPAQDGLQLAARVAFEVEPAHELAHGDGLAEARHAVEHPAFEVVCVVYLGFRYEDGAGGGT